MEDNVGTIAQDFTKASKEMQVVAKKGQDKTKKQSERVKTAKQQ